MAVELSALLARADEINAQKAAKGFMAEASKAAAECALAGKAYEDAATHLAVAYAQRGNFESAAAAVLQAAKSPALQDVMTSMKTWQDKLAELQIPCSASQAAQNILREHEKPKELLEGCLTPLEREQKRIIEEFNRVSDIRRDLASRHGPELVRGPIYIPSRKEPNETPPNTPTLNLTINHMGGNGEIVSAIERTVKSEDIKPLLEEILAIVRKGAT